MEEEQKYDEFGIPIKAEQPKQEVDEFGIPIKKKDFPTASEESLAKESTSTSQQNLLNSEKSSILPVEDVDSVVSQKVKDWAFNHYQSILEKQKDKTGTRPQTAWTANERSKVREYNSTLSDISSTIQDYDVQHFLDVVKSPTLKGLTEKTDEIKREKLSLSLQNKINRAKKLRGELKEQAIVPDENLDWVNNDPLAFWDNRTDLTKEEIDKAKNRVRFMTATIGNSLICNVAAMAESDKESFLAEKQDIVAHYEPSKLAEYASIGAGFMLDTPLFIALGGVGGLGAKAFTRAAVRTTTKELMQLGLTAVEAQGIALQSLSGAARLGIKGTAGAISGSGVLGTYDAINDVLGQYKEAYANGEDLEHYDWRRTLEAWGEGMLIGTATGFVSPLFSSAGEALSSGIKRQALKQATKGAVGGLDFATESTLFTAIPAALDDRAITQDDIVESGLMLLAIKGGNLPLKMVGRINVSKTKGKPIEYTDRERELLGVTTDPYESIRNMSVEDLKKIEANRDISTLTKLKIMENHSGIAPRGEISIDAIRVEKEGDRVFLRTYRKEKEGSKYEYELLSENEYADKTLADAEAKKGLEMLYDLEIRKAMQDLPVRQQGLAANRISEVLGADSKKLNDVLDIPVFARNEEQRAIAQKFYEVANEITGLGKNAYESKMLEDSFGTEKLHLKEREISPKKEEVIQTTTEGEKVAEMPTTEAKKEESSVIAAPYYDTVIENASEAQQLRQNESYKAHIKKTRELATSLGLEVVEIKDYIGGFVNTEGKKITEISNEFKVKGDIESAEKFAAILGTTTPDTQESTIALKYLKEGETAKELVHEYSIKVSDADKTLKSLREAEIFDYSLNESDGTLKLLDFSLGEGLEFKNKLRNLLVELKKEGVEYGEQTKRDIDSRYIDPRRRGEILDGLAGDAEFIRQGGGSLREVVEQSRQRHKEYTERVSHAKKVGEEVKITSQEEVLKGEEGEQVRVRESAEVGVETETGKIDETKEKGLQGRSLAYEVGEIEEELSYDFTKETKKEVKAKYDKAKGRLNEVIEKNRSVLDEIDPKYTKHLIEQVNRLRPENATRVIKNVQKILENAQLREKVKGAFESKKKLEDLRNKPEWTQFIKGLDMKTRMGKKGKELSVRLNRIPVEKLPDTIIDDYIDVVNSLSSDKPDLGKVENFMNTYEAEIRKQEDLANIVVRDDKKAIERITMDAERLRLGMMVADATPEDIMTLKRQLGSLVGQAEKMRRIGVYERNEKGIKVWEDKLAELQTFIEELPALTEEAQGKVKELEKQYKTQTIDEVSSRWNTLKESFVEDGKNTFTEGYEGRRVNEVMATLDKIKNDEWALERLSLSDVDDMVTNLDFIEYNKENPVANLTFHEKADRILGIYKASKAKGSIFDVVNANKESRRINDMLRMPVEKLAKKIGMRPDIHTGSLLRLTGRVKGDTKFKYIPEFIQNQMNLAGSMINNPIYNDITHPASEAINSAEKLTKDFLEPLYKELGLQRQSIFERYVFDFGKNRKDVKVFDRIKILESQLRAFEIMNDAQGRVIQSGEKFYGVELDGTPYKEGNKVKMFDTAQEAIDYVKSKPIDRVGDRPLDFFAILNYDKDGNYSKERNNAVIAKGEKMNELEKMYFEEAYKDILGRAKKNNPDVTDLSQIRTEEDALSLLDANERKLWGLFRDAYKKSEEIMSVVAASEGLALKTSNLYTPMNSRSMADMSYDKMTILDDLMSQAREGKRLEVTGNIYAKTKALKYIDFNGLRSFEKYVRDMSMSYYVIPEMRKQEIALKELAKEYKDSDISNLAKALKENILQGYQAEYSKRSMWGNMKLVQGKTVYDISKALKFTSQAVRNKLLNKSIRIAMDVTPNTIKMADKGFAKIDNKSEWKTFYSYNTGVMGAIDNLRYGQNKIGEYAVVENKGVAQTVADSWVSMGDNFSKSRWPAAFENAFQKLSGEKFDVKQYAYDWKYRDRINSMDSFSQAKSIADGYLEENLVPENKFSNRKYVNLLGYKMSTSNRMYDFLNQMSSYSAQENMGLMAYYNDIMYGSDEAAKVAYMKVGQMLAANMTYNIMSQLAYNGTMYLSGVTFDSDEAKRISSENIKEMWTGTNLLANLGLSASNLMLGGYMNMGRAMLSLGYNGLKSATKLGADKKEVYRTNLAFKEWDKVYGTNRLIDPTLDFTKRSVPWESVVNVALPVTGSQFLQMASDVGTLGKQGKALVSTGEKYETDEFKMSEVVRATNAVLGAYINPFASDVNIMAKALNDEMYKSQLPVELFEADKIIHNFSLTYDEVNEIFDQTYNDVLARAKKDKIDNPEDVARRIANKKVQSYLDDVDNDNYYYLYTKGRNREYIDGLYELMKEINADKTLKSEEKRVLNEKMSNEALRLQSLYDAYVKGDKINTVFTYKDQDVWNQYLSRGIDEKVQNKLNLMEKKLIRYR